MEELWRHNFDVITSIWRKSGCA